MGGQLILGKAGDGDPDICPEREGRVCVAGALGACVHFGDVMTCQAKSREQARALLDEHWNGRCAAASAQARRDGRWL